MSIDTSHTLKDKRENEGHVRRKSPDVSAATDIPEDHLTDVLRDMSTRLEHRAASEAELRTRLELTEKAESTLQAERDHLLRDLERERAQLEEVERNAEELVATRE